MGHKELGASVLVVVAAILGWNAFRPSSDVREKTARRLEAASEVPEIALDRLARLDTARGAPSRDVFKYGADSRLDLSPVPTPRLRLAPTPVATPLPTPEGEPTPTPWPTLNISLTGIVDNGVGGKIASFVKDGEILLVGRPGQVLGNAFRVLRVGTESAEIEELGSGRTRRLPLKTY
ncbi:MAG: hypothetical protein ABI565_11970 [Vicinamibacteria bacterium]